MTVGDAGRARPTSRASPPRSPPGCCRTSACSWSRPERGTASRAARPRVPRHPQHPVRDRARAPRWRRSRRAGWWRPSWSRPAGCSPARWPASTPRWSSGWPSTWSSGSTPSRAGTPSAARSWPPSGSRCTGCRSSWAAACSTARSTRSSPGSCSSGTPSCWASGRRTTASGRQPAGDRAGRRARGAGPAARHRASTTRPCSSSTTRASPPTSSPPGTSTAGGRTPGATGRTCSPSRRSCSPTRPRPGRCASRTIPDEVRLTQGLTLPLSYAFAPGAEEDGVTVDVPLAVLDRVAARDVGGVAGLHRAGPARGTGDGAAAHAAQAAAPRARADPRPGARGAAAHRPGRAAAARRWSASSGGRSPSSPAGRVAAGPGARPPAGHLPGARRPASGRWRPARTSRRCAGRSRRRAGPASPGRPRSVERTGPHVVGAGRPPPDGRGPARPGTWSPPTRRWSTRARPSACASSPTQAEADRLTWGGARRLLVLVAGSPVRQVVKGLSPSTRLALQFNPDGEIPDLVADCVDAAADELIAAAGGPPRDRAAFDALVATAKQQLLPLTTDTVRRVEAVLTAGARGGDRDRCGARPAGAGRGRRGPPPADGRAAAPGLRRLDRAAPAARRRALPAGHGRTGWRSCRPTRCGTSCGREQVAAVTAEYEQLRRQVPRHRRPRRPGRRASAG